MATYVLSIVVDGPGTDPNHRSHWALAVHQANAVSGMILQVSVLDLERLIYQFDRQNNAILRNRGSEGSFAVASLAPGDVRRAVDIINQEAAPSDGVERCQDWVLRVVIALEAEEIIHLGTSDWISGLVGQSAAEVERAVGLRWTRTENETNPQRDGNTLEEGRAWIG